MRIAPAALAAAAVVAWASPAAAQRLERRFAESRGGGYEAPRLPTEDTAAASTQSERLLLAWLVGTPVLVAGVHAGAASSNEAMPAVVLPLSYAAAVTAGVALAAAGREGARPSRTFGGAFLGALPLAVTPFVPIEWAVPLAAAAWILSPIAASRAHAR